MSPHYREFTCRLVTTLITKELIGLVVLRVNTATAKTRGVAPIKMH